MCFLQTEAMPIASDSDTSCFFFELHHTASFATCLFVGPASLFRQHLHQLRCTAQHSTVGERFGVERHEFRGHEFQESGMRMFCAWVMVGKYGRCMNGRIMENPVGDRFGFLIAKSEIP